MTLKRRLFALALASLATFGAAGCDEQQLSQVLGIAVEKLAPILADAGNGFLLEGIGTSHAPGRGGNSAPGMAIEKLDGPLVAGPVNESSVLVADNSKTRHD